VDLIVLDDASEPNRVGPCLRELTERTDVQLGPYSTQLMRAANMALPELDCLLWNHGGSGDDVEAAHPGRTISILTPTSGYAQPFVRMVSESDPGTPLILVAGRGSFARQVITGAEMSAQRVGVPIERNDLGAAPADGAWNLFCAGTFEQDVETVHRARAMSNPPRLIGCVAAGVREFGTSVPAPTGIYGIAQWLPGQGGTVALGPSEESFLLGYAAVPDYPAVQAVAAAVLARYCSQVSGFAVDALWRTATTLRTTTLYGKFAVDPLTGAQRAHETVLTQWSRDGLRAAVKP
jgi:hypothetical protein